MNKKVYPFYHTEDIYTLKDFLDLCDKKYAKKVAFSFERKKEMVKKTYHEFYEEVIKLSNNLIDNNYHEKKIAIMGENSYEWILSYFAIANTKNVVVPIDKELDFESIKRILEKTGTELLFYSNDYSDYADEIKKSDLPIKLVNMNDILFSIINHTVTKKEIQKYKAINIKPDDEIAIIFTSGTTGDPKGVMLMHKNVTRNTTSGMKFVEMKNKAVLALPLHHTYAFSCGVLCVMFAGCENFINRSLKNFSKDLEEQKPTFILTVPLVVETFYKRIKKTLEEKKKLSLVKFMIGISNFLRVFGIDVRRKLFKSILEALGGNLSMIICGGAALDKKYQIAFDNIGINVLEGYGITECAPLIAVNCTKYYRFGSAGLPLTCAEVKIDKNHGEDVGEILAKGDMVMKGYYQNEEATKAVMEDGFFRTGDIGYIDKDGFIFITGRKKNVIILSNGKNVYPEELEFKLLNDDGVQEVVVREDNECIEAEIFPDADYIEKMNIKDVKEYMQKVIDNFNKSEPLYKNISKIKIRDTEFPKTTTKKIKRG